MQIRKDSFFTRAVFSTAITYYFYKLFLGLYNIVSGTGNWVSDISFKWALFFFLFTILLVSLLIIFWLLLWKIADLQQFGKYFIYLRQKLSAFRWGFILVLLVSPVYFLQYTLWGYVFTAGYFKFFLWAASIFFVAVFLTKEKDTLISWRSLLASVALLGVCFTLASAFSNVKNYPFSLYWSDGNRIWDYSLLFGRELYNYPHDQPLEAFISTGRQFLWGIPFLVSGISIFWVRFWSAFVLTIPYMVLGWLVFRPHEKKDMLWFFAGLWTFLFLNQGPIYTPLILSAILVAIAWRRPLSIALPLVFIASYYAQATRWTWLFAPAIWIVILEFSGATKMQQKVWKRTLASGVAGILGGYLFPQLISLLQQGDKSLLTVSEISGTITRQPLLWYRLLPNETNPEGVLLGLLFAILPALISLFYVFPSIDWKFPRLQKLTLYLGLLSFLLVGLIISTKIGGGNNLHNLDMFLIALLFVLAIAWKNGDIGSLFSSDASETIKLVVLLLIALPVVKPLLSLRPQLSLTQEEIIQIQVLTDFDASSDAPLKTLPSEEDVQNVLRQIHTYTTKAAQDGEVLFIDQRQLLTFGYVPAIPLVPDYEKKFMMEQSMSNNKDYFLHYYQDLAAHRFTLIVSEPLKVPIKEEGAFSEEGDAWTKWVAAPTLCFYEPIFTDKDIYVQLLIPRENTTDCSSFITP